MALPHSPAPESPTLIVDALGIGWITFRDPELPHTVLTEAVLRRLAHCIGEASTRAFP
jgi:hypothetical protein